MTNPDGDEVTVQNVADRAGLSLRAFYRHFPSKDELLLAVFEEAIRTNAQHLQQEIAASDDPLERVRIFATEYYRSCRSGQTRHADKRLPGRKLGPFGYQLLFDHPDEAAHAFIPLVSLLRRLLDDASAARRHPGGPRQRTGRRDHAPSRSCSTPSPPRSPGRPPTTCPIAATCSGASCSTALRVTDEHAPPRCRSIRRHRRRGRRPRDCDSACRSGPRRSACVVQ